MNEYEQCRCLRVSNQSAVCIRAEVQLMQQGKLKTQCCELIQRNNSGFIPILDSVNQVDNSIISFYYCIGHGWKEFSVVDIDALNVNQLWVTEKNGLPQLSMCKCEDESSLKYDSYYIQLFNNANALMRIYVSYYVNSIFYSKKMPAIITGMDKKLYIPKQSYLVAIQIQKWESGWSDVEKFYWDELKDNNCFSSYETSKASHVLHVQCD